MVDDAQQQNSLGNPHNPQAVCFVCVYLCVCGWMGMHVCVVYLSLVSLFHYVIYTLR